MTKKKEYGTKNLIPSTKRTEEERKAIAKSGGIKSGQVRKANKARRIMLGDLLKLNAPEKISGKLAKLYGLDPNDVTIDLALDLAQANKAITKSDTSAYNAVKDRVYGKPTQKVEQQTEIKGKPILELEIINGKS